MNYFTIPILLFFSFVLADNENFVNGTQDIPLFKGMQNVEDSLVVFDKSNGRIVLTETEGEIELKKVKEFYHHILPNLGWVKNQRDQYFREGESLEISFTEINGKVIARFTFLSKN